MCVLVFCARDGQVRMIIGAYFKRSLLISLHISNVKPVLLFTSVLFKMLQQAVSVFSATVRVKDKETHEMFINVM